MRVRNKHKHIIHFIHTSTLSIRSHLSSLTQQTRAHSQDEVKAYWIATGRQQEMQPLQHTSNTPNTHLLTQTTHNTVSSSSISHTQERRICNCEEWHSHSIWHRSPKLSQPRNDRWTVTTREDNSQPNYYWNDVGRIVCNFCRILQHLQPIDNPELSQIVGRLKGGEWRPFHRITPTHCKMNQDSNHTQ